MARNIANGEAIRDIRELAGFSQTAFAAELGITRQALAKIEAGGGTRPANIKRAAEILRVPVTALLMDGDASGEPVPVGS